jgi:lipid II:glycine glycyltransferase (peptidoglycan interpeptide bridge formation enzyme)
LTLWKNIIEPGLGFILLAYRGEQPLAAAIFLCWHRTLVYKYSATSGHDKELSPNDPLMWSAICWGCENGLTLLDMGKSDISNQGLRYFKKRWGAEEKPLVYSSISTNPSPPKNEKLINMMQPILQKSPPWVCRLSGELLYKHFG